MEINRHSHPGDETKKSARRGIRERDNLKRIALNRLRSEASFSTGLEGRGRREGLFIRELQAGVGDFFREDKTRRSSSGRREEEEEKEERKARDEDAIQRTGPRYIVSFHIISSPLQKSSGSYHQSENVRLMAGDRWRQGDRAAESARGQQSAPCRKEINRASAAGSATARGRFNAGPSVARARFRSPAGSPPGDSPGERPTATSDDDGDGRE